MELGSTDHVSDLVSTALNDDVVLELRIVELLIVVIPLRIGIKAFVSICCLYLLRSHET